MTYKTATIAFCLVTFAGFGTARAQAPFCPAGHSQSECDAIWAASNAVAASQGKSNQQEITAGANAYMAAQAEPPKAPPYIPPQARMKMIYETADLLSRATGETVVIKRLVFYTEGEELICGQALFGTKLQSFALGGDQLQRGLTKNQMEALGCLRVGGVVLANY